MARMALACAVLLVATSGCGDDGGGGDADGDGGVDRDASIGTPDAGGDADGGSDAGAEPESDAGSPVGPEVCPLSADARALLDEIVLEHVSDAVFTATQSHYREAAFALSLAGVEEGYMGIASLAFDCADESWYDPYCSDGGITPGGGDPAGEFWSTRNRCSRLGCGGANVDVQQIFFTMNPHTLPDDRHAFTYDMVTPAGTATWDPNPMVIWRIAAVTASQRRVTSPIDRSLQVVFASGEGLSFAHTGQIDVLADEGEIQMAALSFTFPDLAPSDAVDASLSIDGTGRLAGSATHGTDTLVQWSAEFGGESVHEWLGGCAD